MTLARVAPCSVKLRRSFTVRTALRLLVAAAAVTSAACGPRPPTSHVVARPLTSYGVPDTSRISPAPAPAPPTETGDEAEARILREQAGSYCDRLADGWDRYGCLVDRLMDQANRIRAKHDAMERQAGSNYMRIWADPATGLRAEDEHLAHLIGDATILEGKRCKWLPTSDAQSTCLAQLLCMELGGTAEKCSACRVVDGKSQRCAP